MCVCVYMYVYIYIYNDISLMISFFPLISQMRLPRPEFTFAVESLSFPLSTLVPLWEGHQCPLIYPISLSLGEVTPCSPK